MSNFKTVLTELADAFTRAKRANGETFYRLKDDCASWITSQTMCELHTALDDRLPDDWVYEQIANIAEHLAGYDPTMDEDTAMEAQHELCDSLVDIYNSARTGWLASHIGNADLCDIANKEFGEPDTDMFTRIGQGQYYALTMLCGAVIHAVTTEAEFRDEQEVES